jgi:hypothetical protein
MTGRRAGWSIVPTTMGMVVSTVGLGVLAGVMMSTSHLQTRSLSRTELTAVGEATLDQLRSHATRATADTTRLSLGGSLTRDVAHHHDLVTTPGAAYTVRWLVTPGFSGTRDVTVRVHRDGSPESVDLNVFILIR